MNIEKIPGLPGGLALHRPVDSHVNPTIYNLPLQPHYYLPLVDYSRNVAQPLVAVGDTVLGGECLADGIIAPTSGEIIDLVEHPWPHPSNATVPTLILKADSHDTFAAWESLEASQCSYAEKLARINQAAVHGLGGAAFSAAKKIQRASESNKRTLIINAVECEPGICCDDALLQQQTADVLIACNSLCEWLDIPTALFAIEDDKSLAIENIKAAIDQHKHTVQLIVLPTIYPSGAETPLVRRLTGITLANKQRPADAGILCLNVATVLSIHRALQGHAAVDRIVSITTRDLIHSVNIRTRFGAPIKALLEYAKLQNSAVGDELDKNRSTVHIGGPVSGFNMTLNESPVIASTNAVLVGLEAEPSKSSACIRCTECSVVCPVNLLPQELYSAATANDLALATRYSLDACVLCGCCDLVCPASIPLTNWFRYAKDATNQQRNEIKAADLARVRSEKHNDRIQRLATEKSLADKERRAAAAERKGSSNDIKAALARVKKKRPQP